jgi:hypothetical protein
LKLKLHTAEAGGICVTHSLPHGVTDLMGPRHV